MPPGFGWVGGNEGGRRHFEKMCAWVCAFGKRFLAVRDDGVGVACRVVGGTRGYLGKVVVRLILPGLLGLKSASGTSIPSALASGRNLE